MSQSSANLSEQANIMSDTQPLWTPNPARQQKSQIFDFMGYVATKTGIKTQNYQQLHDWSVDKPAEFWSLFWDYADIKGEKGAAPYLVDADKMPGARFFPQGRINYAENMLVKNDDSAALIFRSEGKFVERVLSWKELNEAVSRTQQLLQDLGVEKGDRVAAFMPNMPETIIAMLAAASIGAIWSSASPDFGVQGVLDRFGQIEPKVMIAVESYYYNGKQVDCLQKLAEIAPQLPSLKKLLIVDYTRENPDIASLGEKAVSYKDALQPYQQREISYQRLDFNHPLFIMFSSGTTGIPKCIVHGHGGTALQHLKEHRLHCDSNQGDVIFYFTTCGWMMWNWLVGALGCGATLALFDGSPFYPDGNVLFDYAQDHKFKLFGTSAKYIDALKKQGVKPAQTHDLSSVQIMTSTGSPLVAESFDYVYRDIKADLHLASISGGTDIVSCFVLGNPLSAVWRGEIQCAGLGMDVTVLDDNGQNLQQGQGELVCRKPFPSMPVSFWNDESGEKYFNAYFASYKNIWCHGDWIERTQHGGYIIHGRSDATLNPQGVRIGTAEIYRQVEQLPEIVESIAVGQDWDNDVRVVLFVRLAGNVILDDDLQKKIKTVIRVGASPRHVPAKILAVADIPRTKSGKITELAVREVIHSRPVKNVEALANPEALELFKNRAELQTD